MSLNISNRAALYSLVTQSPGQWATAIDKFRKGIPADADFEKTQRCLSEMVKEATKDTEFKNIHTGQALDYLYRKFSKYDFDPKYTLGTPLRRLNHLLEKIFDGKMRNVKEKREHKPEKLQSELNELSAKEKKTEAQLTQCENDPKKYKKTKKELQKCEKKVRDLQEDIEALKGENGLELLRLFRKKRDSEQTLEWCSTFKLKTLLEEVENVPEHRRHALKELLPQLSLNDPLKLYAERKKIDKINFNFDTAWELTRKLSQLKHFCTSYDQHHAKIEKLNRKIEALSPVASRLTKISEAVFGLTSVSSVPKSVSAELKASHDTFLMKILFSPLRFVEGIFGMARKIYRWVLNK